MLWLHWKQSKTEAKCTRIARADVIVGTLARHGLVARSVRVRGRAVDADLLTKSIGARPSGDAIVFAFRRGERATAVIARITGGHGAG